jgi:D-alanyl-D-alanine carboxypeptidase (penicillin-binding protein 5/6)
MRALRGLVVAALITLPMAAPAFADSPVVGGERLATRGTVVAAGAPRLPKTVAASWVVADLDTGEVLGARDPHGRYAPASTLKALTAHTVIPNLDPRALVEPTFADLNVEGSKVGLVQNARYSVKELLTAMLVVSGNDAANAVATANGGLAKTVAEMNAEAKRLKAHDTHAANTNGLDAPGQLSSAYDLALIGRAGMQHPQFREYVAIKRSSIQGTTGKPIAIATHNRLVWNYDGAIGIKNGYTSRAQATFIGAATRGGRTLIVTLMKTHPRYWPEAASLLDWGFAAARAEAVPVGTLVDPEPDLATLLSAPTQESVTPAASRTSLDEGGSLRRNLLIGFGSLAAPVVVLRARVRLKMRRRRRRLALPRY